MKSLYAVAGQMALSASNYVVFVLLARLLSPDDFIAFSIAVGLNMLAYAVAEGGVSYVAPRELADRSDVRAGAMAGAFIAISAVLYMASMTVGYFLWNALSQDPLDVRWVLAYGLYFVPALLMPAWVTCWSMDRVSVAVLIIVRAAIVVAVYLQPGPLTLAVCGLVFLAFVVWLLVWLNRTEWVIGWVDSAAIRVAAQKLSEVFAAKTMSYAVYSLLPLVVGALRGNAAASIYVTGERVKSLYATVFQPLIMTVYLWQFQWAGHVERKRLVIWVVNTVNLVVCVGLLFAIHAGLLELLGERFAVVAEMPAYVVAAGLSVTTASLLYFHVFPSGDYTLFRRASVGQLVTFGALFAGMVFFSGLSPAWVLCTGEAMLLVSVLGNLLFRRFRSLPYKQRLQLMDQERENQ